MNGSAFGSRHQEPALRGITDSRYLFRSGSNIKGHQIVTMFAADAMHGCEVRVFQRCRSQSFVFEALPVARLHGGREREHYQGHAAFQR